MRNDDRFEMCKDGKASGKAHRHDGTRKKKKAMNFLIQLFVEDFVEWALIEITRFS